jgi:hypothetical protein
MIFHSAGNRLQGASPGCCVKCIFLKACTRITKSGRKPMVFQLLWFAWQLVALAVDALSHNVYITVKSDS